MKALIYSRVEIFGSSLFNNLEKILLSKGYTIEKCLKTDLEKMYTNNYDLIVTVGGDGTLLDIVNLALKSSAPIIGINKGRLGYLTSIESTQINEKLPPILSGDCYKDFRDVLDVENIPGQNEKIYGLNEVTVQKYGGASMIEIEIKINDEYAGSFIADGVMISTTSGSTAYSLSCGGSIIFPDVPVFIVNFIAPHDLSVRPLIVNDSVKIEIKGIPRAGPYVYITVDSIQWIISSKVQLVIRKGTKKVCILRPPDYSHLKILREKLGWASQINKLR